MDGCTGNVCWPPSCEVTLAGNRNNIAASDSKVLGGYSWQMCESWLQSCKFAYRHKVAACDSKVLGGSRWQICETSCNPVRTPCLLLCVRFFFGKRKHHCCI